MVIYLYTFRLRVSSVGYKPGTIAPFHHLWTQGGDTMSSHLYSVSWGCWDCGRSPRPVATADTWTSAPLRSWSRLFLGRRAGARQEPREQSSEPWPLATAVLWSWQINALRIEIVVQRRYVA